MMNETHHSAFILFRKRETGFEPATSTLARSHSTTELLPLDVKIIPHLGFWTAAAVITEELQRHDLKNLAFPYVSGEQIPMSRNCSETCGIPMVVVRALLLGTLR